MDELLIYMAPKLLGEGMGMAYLPALDTLDNVSSWNLIDHTSIGNDLRIRLKKD